MTDAPVLAVREVSKRFPGVLALDRVSLTVAPGEVHALVGENGAGKSTLIKVLTGVYNADAGEITYAGRPVSFGRPLADHHVRGDVSPGLLLGTRSGNA